MSKLRGVRVLISEYQEQQEILPVHRLASAQATSPVITALHVATHGVTVSALHELGDVGDARQVLALLVDPDRLPALIHCPDGKVLTGIVVWCLRRLQCYEPAACLQEFVRYCGGVYPTREASGLH